MRTIYRYTVPVDDQVHELVAPFDGTGLPSDAAGRSCIVHIACRAIPNEVEVWVQVDTDLPDSPVRLIVTGTGHPAPDEGVHLGTALAPLGLVWHLWRIP